MKQIMKALSDVVFPPVCACCGAIADGNSRHICSWCRSGRFERADEQQFTLLPHTVRFLHVLWQFDKGGYLQDLLHNLKYHFLYDVGVELGRELGRALSEDLRKEKIHIPPDQNPVLVPVPLHPSRLRKRGFNQAGAIAEGMGERLGWRVAASAVQRIRNTRSQTGLKTDERAKNLRDAFRFAEQEISPETDFPVIVDDVFTTGATTFELAQTVAKSPQSAGIVTVAIA